ncbi:MAG TPA: GNAT family N-acetyltransferase [Gemmatimonadales bacterium]
MTRAAIRAARMEDLPAIHALAERLADFELPAWRTAREIARADHHHFIAQLQEPSEHALFLVAEADGAPVGTIFVRTAEDYFTHGPIGYIEVLAVSEAAAGQGVARRLMSAAEEWARARGLVRMDLSVFALNRRARGFYEHLGYEGEFVRYVKPL